MLNKVSKQYGLLCIFTAVVFSLLSTSARANTRLVMIEQENCHYCEKWMVEIGDRYHLTEEGAIAPLRRVHLEDAFPTDLPVALADISLTPTFVLVHNGLEVDRMAGYAGDDFFWGQLQQMLDKLPTQNEAINTVNTQVTLQ